MDHARTPTSEQYLVPRALFDECLLHFATLKRLLLETDVEAVDQDLEAFSKLDLSLQYMQQAAKPMLAKARQPKPAAGPLPPFTQHGHEQMQNQAPAPPASVTTQQLLMSITGPQRPQPAAGAPSEGWTQAPAQHNVSIPTYPPQAPKMHAFNPIAMLTAPRPAFLSGAMPPPGMVRPALLPSVPGLANLQLPPTNINPSAGSSLVLTHTPAAQAFIAPAPNTSGHSAASSSQNGPVPASTVQGAQATQVQAQSSRVGCATAASEIIANINGSTSSSVVQPQCSASSRSSPEPSVPAESAAAASGSSTASANGSIPDMNRRTATTTPATTNGNGSAPASTSGSSSSASASTSGSSSSGSSTAIARLPRPAGFSQQEAADDVRDAFFWELPKPWPRGAKQKLMPLVDDRVENFARVLRAKHQDRRDYTNWMVVLEAVAWTGQHIAHSIYTNYTPKFLMQQMARGNNLVGAVRTGLKDMGVPFRNTLDVRVKFYVDCMEISYNTSEKKVMHALEQVLDARSKHAGAIRTAAATSAAALESKLMQLLHEAMQA